MGVHKKCAAMAKLVQKAEKAGVPIVDEAAFAAILAGARAVPAAEQP